MRQEGQNPVSGDKERSGVANALFDLAREFIENLEAVFDELMYLGGEYNQLHKPAIRLAYYFGHHDIGGVLRKSPTWSCLCFGKGNETIYRDSAFNFDM